MVSALLLFVLWVLAAGAGLGLLGGLAVILPLLALVRRNLRPVDDRLPR